MKYQQFMVLISFFVLIAGGATSQELPLAYPNCGLYALAAISAPLGKPVTCESLAQIEPKLSESLVSIDDMIRTAEKVGIPLKALRGGSVPVLLEVPPPYIIGLRSNHLVAVLGRENGSLQILDQSGEKKMLTSTDLEKEWSGELLQPGAIEDFPDSLPMVHILNHKIHLGVLDNLNKVTVRFVAYNFANEPIQLHIVEKSCGCLTPTFNPNLVPPGEPVEIKAEFSPKDSINPKQKESFVVEWSLDTGNYAARETFEIAAIIKKPAQMVPTVLQGEIYNGKWTQGKLATELQTGEISDKWKISGARWSFRSLGELILSASAVQIQPPKDFPVGEYHDFLVVELKTEDNKKSNDLSLPVHIQVISDIQVTPKILDFGFVEDISKTKKTIHFQDAKGRTLQIVSVPPELEMIQDQADKTGSQSITVRMNPNLTNKIVSKDCLFTVKTDNQVEQIQVKVQAVLN